MPTQWKVKKWEWLFIPWAGIAQTSSIPCLLVIKCRGYCTSEVLLFIFSPCIYLGSKKHMLSPSRADSCACGYGSLSSAWSSCGCPQGFRVGGSCVCTDWILICGFFPWYVLLGQSDGFRCFLLYPLDSSKIILFFSMLLFKMRN